MKLLVIEDDLGICNFLRLALVEAQYEVLLAHTALKGVETYYSQHPDLVILDLGLDDIDGTEVIKQIRLDGQTPIIVVSAREADSEKVQALDLGANDYLTKPFSINELLARLRAILRFKQQMDQSQNAKENLADKQEPPIFVGDTFIADFQARRITRCQDDETNENVSVGGEIHLTRREFDLIEVFASHPGYLLTHKFLQETVWGYTDEASAVSIRVYVRSLRQKLGTKLISTEVGMGYRLNPLT